jgi:hypothetical protein
MKRVRPRPVLALAALAWVAVTCHGSVAAPAGKELAPLKLRLPIPGYIGTPPDLQYTPHMEKPSDKPRPAFMAPAGVENVALKKKVTTSDPDPIGGEPTFVTDGYKEADPDAVLEMRRGVQWAQIDLENPHEIYAIVVWHAHNEPIFFRAVVVQVSNDPEFKTDVKTLFNNDYANLAGLGAGADKEYMENHEGRLIDAKGAQARYVRLYSRGSTASAYNAYTEVEVYALPVK